MRSRHSGWLARYLESFIPNNESVENLPQSCNSLCTVQGLKKVPARTLLILNNHHVDAW